jgi:hypothetical protein
MKVPDCVANRNLSHAKLDALTAYLLHAVLPASCIPSKVARERRERNRLLIREVLEAVNNRQVPCLCGCTPSKYLEPR